MTATYVLSLSDPRATLPLAGGKGASLARLAGAGLPVPDGFYVTTAAYQLFVTENGLQSRILAALQTADPAQPATLETASAQIGALFAAALIPPRHRRRNRTYLCRSRRGLLHLASCLLSRRRAFLRHRRRPARPLFRRSAGNLPQRAGYRRGAGRRPTLLGQPVDGASHRLPDAARHRPGDGGPGGGRATARTGGGRRRHVHRQPVYRAARPGDDQRCMGAGRNRGRWDGGGRSRRPAPRD